ncbi:MAG: hypothetical protein HQL32_11685 [Planctomycetes bacterium]|nr:hypothetical protein [Planctomycetota bacterium]
MKMKNSPILIFCLYAVSWASLLSLSYADNEKDDIYYDYLSVADLGVKEALLKEFSFRKISTREVLNDYFLNEENASLRPVLLDVVPAHFINSEAWLSKTKFSLSERNILWHRAVEDAGFGKELSLDQFSATFFAEAKAMERDLLILLHGKLGSSLLVKELKNDTDSYGSPLILNYFHSVGVKISEQYLKYSSDDSGSLVAAKLKMIVVDSKLRQSCLDSFFKSPHAGVVAQAVRVLGADDAYAYLNHEDSRVSAAALSVVLAAKENYELAYKTLKKENWMELREVFLFLKAQQSECDLKWFEKTWFDVGDQARFVMADALYSDADRRYFPILKKSFGLGVAQESVLKLMLKIEGVKESAWLLELVKENEYSDEVNALAFELLYEWDEAKGETAYVDLFSSRGYRKGKEGGGWLLLLVGKSQLKSGVKYIMENLKMEKEPFYLDVAIEAAGWSAQKPYLSLLPKRNELTKGSLEHWAVQRCLGKNIPFPVEQETNSSIRYDLSYHSKQ